MNYTDKLFNVSSKMIELDDTMNPQLKQVYLGQLKQKIGMMDELKAKNIYDGIRDIFRKEEGKDKIEIGSENVFAK